MKRLLMVAFHFPPMGGASGSHRSVGFARHLPEFGWQPVVLTAHPMAYPSLDMDSPLPPCPIHRAYALDSSRHLAIRGRYFRFTALPDRWSSWRLAAIPLGMALIQRYRPQAIWSTYPLATSHCIAHTLSRWSGLPWVADFRDPMCSPRYPADPFMRNYLSRLEEACITRCQKVVTATPEMVQVQQERLPHLPDHHWQVVENGWDAWPGAGEIRPTPFTLERPLELLHSGTLYSGEGERSPLSLLQCFALLLQQGKIRCLQQAGGGIPLRLTFRACGQEGWLRQQVDGLGLKDLVVIAPPVSRQQALEEMARADGLILLQGEGFNPQVPAKVYEYIQTGRPILPFVHPHGATARLLAAVGIEHLFSLKTDEKLLERIELFLYDIIHNRVWVPSSLAIQPYSRRQRTACLANLLHRLIEDPQQ
ncbi:MAG: glycosyltransferase family 4 protein [Magnetococcales bacterium]|nr:glycosyltransferase [Magnetococcales bacterium]NGZ27217.1 glycosyltransferase family 4 protein [Magnetococcales bacterium]